MKSPTADFRKLVRRLRILFPTLAPVRVSRRTLGNPRTKNFLQGYTSAVWDESGKRLSHFIIVVHRDLPMYVQKDVLLHEWAHAVAWREGNQTLDHDPEWAMAYARIYQAIVEPKELLTRLEQEVL